MPVTLLTVSEYARHRGCDEKAVRRALAEGRISRIGTERKCIDADVADIQWAKNTRARADSGTRAPAPGPATRRPAAAPAPAAGAEHQGEDGPPGDGYSDWRTRRERAEALMAQIDLAKASGKVLDREAALRAIFTKYRELRDTAMVLGRRLAPIVAPMTDEREIRITIDRAIADVFERFVQRSLQALVDNVTGAPVALPAEVREAPSAVDEPGAEGASAPGEGQGGDAA